MDYGTLIAGKETAGSIRSWINYGLIDAEGVLLDAQSYIFGALRVREMQAEATVEIEENATTAALPERYLDPITLIYKDGNGEIGLKTPQAVHRARQYEEDGTLSADRPLSYAVFNDLIQFEVKADADYSASFLFYRRPELLGPQTARKTNFLTARYPALVRAACIAFAADYRDDTERYTRAIQRCNALISAANVEADLSLRGATLSE
jgi:hypothetical protein